MKKFFVSILCFVYVVASSGATINFHYCMGKFIGLDAAVAAPAICSNCGMGKQQKQGCCNDKHATFQIKKDQLASNINYVTHNSINAIPNHYPTFFQSSLFNRKSVLSKIHSPPLIQTVSTFILNSVFRI